MIGPSKEEIFRTNVGYAKMMLKQPKLDEYLDWFSVNGLPAEPSAIEQAAWELLGLHEDKTPLLNVAFQRWQDGEPNEFFDRITQPIDLSKCIDLTGLRDKEFLRALLGPRDEP